MASVESSRQRSIFGMISCSSRIACSTRASVEKPVLPRRLRESPSFSNRISPSCCGEEIRNSASASAKMSSSSAISSARTRALISARRSRFRRTPSSSISRNTATSGSSISSITRSRPRSAICSRCQAASARSSSASAASGSSRSLARPRSSHSSSNGKRRRAGSSRKAPSSVSCARPGGTRPSALASCATTARSGPLDDLLGTVTIACEHLCAVAGGDGSGETPRRPFGEQLALGRLGLAHDERELVLAGTEAGKIGGRAGAHAAAELDLGGERGRGDLRVAERLFQAPQRVAQLVLAKDLAHARAVGLVGSLGGDVEARRATSRWIVARRFETRASSAWSSRFCLRFGPLISLDVARAPPRAIRSAGSAHSRSCRRSPARRGCCRRCRPSARRSQGSAPAGSRSGRPPPGGRRSSSR